MSQEADSECEVYSLDRSWKGPCEIVPQWEDYCWTFGGCKARWEIEPGVPVSLFTEDCFGGRVRSAAHLPSKVVQYPYLNPQTGPFFVKGAEPGDSIAVHFVSIAPARDWAVSCTVPLYGALVGTSATAMLHDALPELTWVYRVNRQDGLVSVRGLRSPWTVSLPLAPFHGTVGVAPPAGEVRSSIVPDMFGGNMDTPEVCAGSTVYLGVNVPGALLSLGDGHYAMGEGEACGSAVEGAMVTTIVVEVIKGHYCEWPRIESDEAVMVAGSARPLEDAYRVAHAELIKWLVETLRFDRLDVLQVLSQCAKSRIANVVDPNYTIVAKMPKYVLPSDVSFMGGAHDHLSALAVRAMTREA